MPSLKELKNRIGSVKNTQKITRAMKLVAAAKMKRAVDAAVAARPYSNEVTAVLQSLMARVDADANPLFVPHDEVKKIAVVVISADRGLCAGFNNNLLRRVEGFLFENGLQNEAFKSAELILFGRKAVSFFGNRGHDTDHSWINVKPNEFDERVGKLVADLTTRYQAGELDEVYLCFNTFVNTLRQDPTVEKLFPLTHLAEAGGAEPAHLVDFVYEPTQTAILATILPLFLRTRLTQVFLESEAGEHAARMTAMDAATRNATDVIDRITLEYNRARQAYITKELVEIVAGAEAL